jgi:flagellar motor protein MotB
MLGASQAEVMQFKEDSRLAQCEMTELRISNKAQAEELAAIIEILAIIQKNEDKMLQKKDESISELSASIKEQQQRILELTDEKQQQLAEQAAVLALLQQREPKEPGKCLFLSQKHFAHFIFQLTPLGVTKLWHAHPN